VDEEDPDEEDGDAEEDDPNDSDFYPSEDEDSATINKASRGKDHTPKQDNNPDSRKGRGDNPSTESSRPSHSKWPKIQRTAEGIKLILG
jgi:hypothetical protein